MSRQYNIRWKQTDSNELRKAVRNFNAKIDRLTKKNPELVAVFPEKTSVRQLKELIDTRQDLKRELNSLRRFTRRGSEEIVDIPESDYNLQITKWQKEEMTRRTAVINRKRKKRLEEIESMEMTSRGQKLGYTRGQLGMGKADEIALKPLKAFTPRMTRKDLQKKFKSIQLQSQSTYFNTKDEQFRQNYIKGLLENYNIHDIEDVVEKIESMDFKEFYNTFQAEGGTFEFHYPPDNEQYEGYLESLKATWLPNKK